MPNAGVTVFFWLNGTDWILANTLTLLPPKQLVKNLFILENIALFFPASYFIDFTALSV
ncbi:hypothetical protein [Pediococcus acidilactici]|uniref:hypothetical protein n=1 Tax=Pediococcus acidilactici TaxID=1254 RepID=UPI000A6AC8D9|nr:hypothetical protein [Pediococcus acidilactici]WDA28613.1 hypothetical protein PSQ91_03385 [Pediococcus acidilactici]